MSAISWVWKIPWRKKWQPTPVFLTGESNPKDRGAWWATVHSITKSQTRLKQLSMHAGLLDDSLVLSHSSPHLFYHLTYDYFLLIMISVYSIMTI